MRILWDNYLEAAVVTADSVNESYPLSNLWYKMLERKYKSLGVDAEITVTLEEDKPVSMIAYGFNNVISGGSTTYELKSSGGTVVASGVLNAGDNVNVTYLDTAVTCRSIVLKLTAADTLYIGGMAIGDPYEYEYTSINPTFSRVLKSDADKTDGAQLISKRKANYRMWRVALPDMTNAERLSNDEVVEAVGKYKPCFCDLCSDDIPAMFGYIKAGGVYQKDTYNHTYSTTMTIEECK